MNDNYEASDLVEKLVKKDKTEYIIHKVIQALDILEQFHDDVAELTSAEMSKRIDISDRSLELMLATLMARNYLEQDRSTGRFRLGFKTLELAQAVLRQTDLYRVCYPVLSFIAHECQENCAVAVLRKTHVIELESIQAEHPVQVMKRVGVHLPGYCTAAGKVLIALESDEMREAICQGLELQRHTPNTVASIDDLRKELKLIAEQGYAIDDQELDPDVRSVAAAIRDHTGRAVGALVINGPSCRVDLQRIERQLLPLVREGAREISARLGYHETEPPVEQKKKRGARPAASRTPSLH